MLLLFIHCLVLLQLSGVICWFLALWPYFCNHFAEGERTGFFTFIVFLLSCDCLCTVALPRGATDWSAVCDYAIRMNLFLTQYLRGSRKFCQRGSKYDDNHIFS